MIYAMKTKSFLKKQERIFDLWFRAKEKADDANDALNTNVKKINDA